MRFHVANLATFAVKDVLLNPNMVKVRRRRRWRHVPATHDECSS